MQLPSGNDAKIISNLKATLMDYRNLWLLKANCEFGNPINNFIHQVKMYLKKCCTPG